MPRVNLLPWREERRNRRQREFYGLLAAAGAAGALLIGAGEVVLGRIQARQLERNAFIEREIAALDVKIAEIRSLQAEKTALIARMEVIQELQVMRPQAVKLLDGLARATPDGAMLTRFSQRGGDLSLEGLAQSNARVSTFMHNLDDSDRFGEPQLGVIRAADRSGLPVSSFALTVPQQGQPVHGEESAP